MCCLSCSILVPIDGLTAMIESLVNRALRFVCLSIAGLLLILHLEEEEE
jgi:hypothetical protein